MVNQQALSLRVLDAGGKEDRSSSPRLVLDTDGVQAYGLAERLSGIRTFPFPALPKGFPIGRWLMPLDITTFTLVDKPTTLKESLAILERDDYCCQYCGLDGRASFENALVMRVDFVVPRAKKGKKDPKNLVACCGPCNTIKGTKVYKSFEHAKEYVLASREELRKAWEAKERRPAAKAAKA
jgi:hypothetical protein